MPRWFAHLLYAETICSEFALINAIEARPAIVNFKFLAWDMDLQRNLIAITSGQCTVNQLFKLRAQSKAADWLARYLSSRYRCMYLGSAGEVCSVCRNSASTSLI